MATEAKTPTRVRVPVRHVLSQLSVEQLAMLEPFYVTRIRREESDFGGAPEDASGRYVLLFDVISEDGELIGSCKTATRGIVQQLEAMQRESSDENAEFGPVSVGKPMRRDGQEAKAYKFISVA